MIMIRYRYLYILFLIIVCISSCGKRIIPATVTGEKIKQYDSVNFNRIFVEAIKQKLLGNAGDALKYFEQCLKMNPESDAVLFQMAQIVMAYGDVKNGKKYVLKALEIEPENIWYLMMAAGTYYQESKFDSAILYYEKAVKYYPEKK